MERECSRCLVKFKYPVNGVFSISIQDKDALKKTVGDEGSVDYFYSKSDALIDIRDSLYEDVIVNLPIKALCDENCPGLEQYFKNSTQKGDSGKNIDPRWNELKKILNKGKK